MKQIIGQLSWFTAVGCAASATHWLVVVAIVNLASLAPLVANIAGWIVAFGVSFSGHYHLTFRRHEAPAWRAARRFFLVSATGFGINEISYAYLLHATTIRYDVLLAAVLIAIAVFTFILSRFWAFGNKI
ncbi:MAG TPA: GtrA family protein [Pusillimonas sp.]